MSNGMNRRAFIAAIAGIPTSYGVTHLVNRKRAIDETCDIRDKKKAAGRAVPLHEISATYNSQYLRKTLETLPVNGVSGLAIAFVVKSATNPLSQSLRELEEEEPDAKKRSPEFRDIKKYSNELGRRTFFGWTAYGAIGGALSGQMFARMLDHKPTVEHMLGKKPKPQVFGPPNKEHEKLLSSLFAQDCIAFMFTGAGAGGTAGHIYELSVASNDVKDEVDRHKINRSLSSNNTHIMFAERVVDDVRVLLPRDLRTLGTEVTIQIRRNGETSEYNLICANSPEGNKFVVVDTDSRDFELVVEDDALKDIDIPLYNNDEVTITLRSFQP